MIKVVTISSTVVVLLILSFLLVCCSEYPSAITVDSPLVSDTEAPAPTPSPSTSSEVTAAPIAPPLYLPLPYYNVFYPDSIAVGNLDAFLHNTVVNYFSTRNDPSDGHVYIPSLRLLDEWDASDGATYYLFQCAYFCYYDLAQAISGYRINLGTSSELIRIKLTPNNDYPIGNFWSYSSVELISTGPVGSSADELRDFCGDSSIADVIVEADSYSDLPYIRDILPGEYAFDEVKLLDAYLKHFFPEQER